MIYGIFPGKVIIVVQWQVSNARGLRLRPELGGRGGEIPPRYSTIAGTILGEEAGPLLTLPWAYQIWSLLAFFNLPPHSQDP